jgi:hypothetical protein
VAVRVRVNPLLSLELIVLARSKPPTTELVPPPKPDGARPVVTPVATSQLLERRARVERKQVAGVKASHNLRASRGANLLPKLRAEQSLLERARERTRVIPSAVAGNLARE